MTAAAAAYLTADELARYRGLWTGGAARGPWFGRCDGCNHTRREDGRPLLVARRARSRRFLCLLCFILASPPLPKAAAA